MAVIGVTDGVNRLGVPLGRLDHAVAGNAGKEYVKAIDDADFYGAGEGGEINGDSLSAVGNLVLDKIDVEREYGFGSAAFEQAVHHGRISGDRFKVSLRGLKGIIAVVIADVDETVKVYSFKVG